MIVFTKSKMYRFIRIFCCLAVLSVFSLPAFAQPQAAPAGFHNQPSHSLTHVQNAQGSAPAQTPAPVASPHAATPAIPGFAIVPLGTALPQTAAPQTASPPAAAPAISGFALVPTGTATPPAGAPADNGEDMNAEPQETFGTRALNQLINAISALQQDAQNFVVDFSALQEASGWLDRQQTNPHAQAYWEIIGQDLVSVVGGALLVALILEFLLFPVRNNIGRREPSRFMGRLLTGLGLFGIRLLPVIVFLTFSLSLLNREQEPHIVRFFILNVVYALAVSRLVAIASRFILAPRNTALRWIPVSGPQAVYTYRWFCIFSVTIIYGYFCVDVARAVHVPMEAIALFNNLLGLVLVVMTIVVVIQKRAFVSVRLRGDLSAAQPDLTMWQSLRLSFARRWHILAMAYLIIGYLVTAFSVQNGFALMLRGTILTLLIFFVMRFLFHALNHWRPADADESFHHATVRFLLRLVIWGAAVIAIVAGWGVDLRALFATPLGQRILGAGFSIGVTIVAIALIYGAISAAIDSHLNRRDSSGELVQASARARTLLPLIRNTLFIVFTVIVGTVALSEAGLNVGPLLAGAGVLGVAIGFGSQTLVKDFLTGLFIVLENVIAVGDIVKIGDDSGVVERLSIRAVWLRDADGYVHVLPFSDVTRIVNMTKEYAFAVMEVGVAYGTDLEKAMNVIRSVGEDMRNDPVFKRAVMDAVEMWGVDKLGDSSITIRFRIRTRPAKQWDVKRAFLLRLVQRFEKENIEIPYPIITYHTKGQ